VAVREAGVGSTEVQRAVGLVLEQPVAEERRHAVAAAAEERKRGLHVAGAEVVIQVAQHGREPGGRVDLEGHDRASRERVVVACVHRERGLPGRERAVELQIPATTKASSELPGVEVGVSFEVWVSTAPQAYFLAAASASNPRLVPVAGFQTPLARSPVRATAAGSVACDRVARSRGRSDCRARLAADWCRSPSLRRA